MIYEASTSSCAIYYFWCPLHFWVTMVSSPVGTVRWDSRKGFIESIIAMKRGASKVQWPDRYQAVCYRLVKMKRYTSIYTLPLPRVFYILEFYRAFGLFSTRKSIIWGWYTSFMSNCSKSRSSLKGGKGDCIHHMSLICNGQSSTANFYSLFHGWTVYWIFMFHIPCQNNHIWSISPRLYMRRTICNFCLSI